MANISISDAHHNPRRAHQRRGIPPAESRWGAWTPGRGPSGALLWGHRAGGGTRTDPVPALVPVLVQDRLVLTLGALVRTRRTGRQRGGSSHYCCSSGRSLCDLFEAQWSGSRGRWDWGWGVCGRRQHSHHRDSGSELGSTPTRSFLDNCNST